jgi:hypothetical protein
MALEHPNKQTIQIPAQFFVCVYSTKAKQIPSFFVHPRATKYKQNRNRNVDLLF